MSKETKEEVKLKNGKLIELTRVYKKITNTEMDFENLEAMSSVIDDVIVIDDAIKSYSKLEEKLREDAQKKMKDADQDQQIEIQNDFVKKINVLADKEVVLSKALSKVSVDLCKKAKLTIAEYKTLKELELV